MAVRQYVQVRPVTWDAEFKQLDRALEGDTIEAWGVYRTNAEGLPLWKADRDTREGAVQAALEEAFDDGLPIMIDELDGTTTELA